MKFALPLERTKFIKYKFSLQPKKLKELTYILKQKLQQAKYSNVIDIVDKFDKYCCESSVFITNSKQY